MDRLSLGPVGVALNVSESYLGEAAAELERLGYSALWLPGGQIDNLDRLAEVVRATKTARAGPMPCRRACSQGWHVWSLVSCRPAVW